MIKCSKCGILKDFEFFRIRSEGHYRKQCKDCEFEYRKSRYNEKKSDLLQINKIYRQKNAQILLDKRRKRYGMIPRNGVDILKLKETNKRAHENYVKRYPEKIECHRKVRRALDLGILSKPSECCMCQKPKKVEAHHDDYSKPLDVLWVCRQCHLKKHGKLK